MNTENAKKHLATKARGQVTAAYQVIDLLYAEACADKETAVNAKDEDLSLALHACGIKDKEIERLNEQIATLTASIETTKQEHEIAFDEYCSSLDMAYKRIEVQDEQIAALEAAVKEKSFEFATAVAIVSGLKKQITDLETAVFEKRSEIVALKIELRARKLRNERLKKHIAALSDERNRLKRFWDAYAREVDKLAFEAQEEKEATE